jgi:N-glycosylase/DNA lyase
MSKITDSLIELYKIKKYDIDKRLGEFQGVLTQSDERIFAELVFCICTPQSKATVCWSAVEAMMKNRLLYAGDICQIKPFLNAVRFGESKAKYIVEARKLFTNDRLDIKKIILSFNNSFELKDWLVKNVKGIGLKEASHFIRNIGFDYENQLAILDRHILKNLKEFGVINEIPNTLTSKKYFEIENRMKKFAETIDISLYELDLLLWSKETGIIFK